MQKINDSNKLFVNLAFRDNVNTRKKTGRRSSSNFGKKMKYLEGTEDEVLNIKSILQQMNWNINLKTDKNVGEFDLKKDLEINNPGIIHIATHGFAFPEISVSDSGTLDDDNNNIYKQSEDPMFRCGLMLSGSNISWIGKPENMLKRSGEDGILTAAEVANLNLSNTKLVVLSACETGLGQVESTEGTFGLKRGFKLAGLEQIIVSLWSVPDKETMDLMTLFYKDLTKTLNPVVSFEKAQKELRNTYPKNPEKWAGFVLVR
jgi:CHAT domain-containing protein